MQQALEEAKRILATSHQQASYAKYGYDCTHTLYVKGLVGSRGRRVPFQVCRAVPTWADITAHGIVMLSA